MSWFISYLVRCRGTAYEQLSSTMYEMSSDSRKTRDEARAERARERLERAEAKVRDRSEQAQEKIARAMGKGAEAEDQVGEQVAQLIWFRQEPASRRPAHTRADIARAALEIADTQGFDAVSMRRVAERLGAGTMTLYHYVRNKEELVALMSD